MIRKGDSVIILLGPHTGKVGEVIRFWQDANNNTVYELALADHTNAGTYYRPAITSVYCPNCDYLLTSSPLQFGYLSPRDQRDFGINYPVPFCGRCRKDTLPREPVISSRGAPLLLWRIGGLVLAAIIFVFAKLVDMGFGIVFVLAAACIVLGFWGYGAYDRLKHRNDPSGLGLNRKSDQ